MISVSSARLKPQNAIYIWKSAVRVNIFGEILQGLSFVEQLQTLLVLKPLGLKCICSGKEYSKLLREKYTSHKSSFLPHSVSLSRKSHNIHTNKVWACFMCCREKRLLGLKRERDWEREKEMLCNCDPVRCGQQSTLSITSRAKCDTRAEIGPSFNKQIPLN